MIKESIASLVSGHSLTLDEAAEVMEEIMRGEATPAQFGALFVALRLKGETADEIAGFARTMRSKAVRVNTDGKLVDTCGTGGDASGTFNISTTAAFVAAGTGIKVAKHGNRAMSSNCGSADVLEALGVKIDLDAASIKECIQSVGIGFMFAPSFHPAMKYATAPRREIGIRTVLNILGPLTNPAGAKCQVLGVAEESLCCTIAQVLKTLNCHHALVVHGMDGLDEITVTRETHIFELKDNDIRDYFISPEDFQLVRSGFETIRGSTAVENAASVRNILAGVRGPMRDIVLLNAAAAIIASDMTDDFASALRIAIESIDSGKALTKLNQMIKFSQKISQG